MLPCSVTLSNLERQYWFRVSAEFYQFIIADLWAEADLDWNERTLIELFTLDTGSIGIGTNCEGPVSVEIQIWSSEAGVGAEPWDHIVECGIEVPSGELVIAGCCEILDEGAFRISLTAGSYGARVYYGNQYAWGDGEPTCTSHYMIMLWPSQHNAVRVIKRSFDLFAEQVS